MLSRRTVVRTGSAGVVALLAGCIGTDSPTDGEPTASVTTVASSGSMAISSSAFDDGGQIPERFTADGEDVSPPLSIDGVPDGAESLALVVDDPDAPGGTFVHWLLWNVPSDTTAIEANVPRARRVDSLGGARQGTNDFGELGYRGPSPPADDGPHTYRVTLYALDGSLDVQAGARRSVLGEAMAGRTIATARSTGTYER